MVPGHSKIGRGVLNGVQNPVSTAFAKAWPGLFRVGRALVADLERLVAARGALTLQLGSDDEDDMTSLGGADLYDDLWARIRDIQDRKGHPFAFYRKLGYTIIGVIPDANGRGKPDILMARRIG